MTRIVMVMGLLVVTVGLVWFLVIEPAGDDGNGAAAEMDQSAATDLPAAADLPAAVNLPAADDPAAAEAAQVLLPDLRVMPPSDISLVGSRAEETLRLKFTTIIYNDGDGPVEVRGEHVADVVYDVTQYFHQPDGDPRAGPLVGAFTFEHRHGHLHLGGFARYELWELDEAGQPTELVVVNPKVGFCLMDNLLVDDATAPPEPVYFDCEADVQGVSVGYGDIYVADLFEQDLDVSAVTPGTYRLVNVTNPGGVIRERDTSNNAAHVDIELGEGTVRVLPGP